MTKKNLTEVFDIFDTRKEFIILTFVLYTVMSDKNNG